MVNQFMTTSRASTKGDARWHLFLFLGKAERQGAYVLTDGVQVVLSKCVRRTDQDWSKYFPINYTSIDPDSEAESHDLLTRDWLEQECTQPAQPAYGASTARATS